MNADKSFSLETFDADEKWILWASNQIKNHQNPNRANQIAWGQNRFWLCYKTATARQILQTSTLHTKQLHISDAFTCLEWMEVNEFHRNIIMPNCGASYVHIVVFQMHLSALNINGILYVNFYLLIVAVS